MNLLLTCEHASNAIPAEFEKIFLEHGDFLKTHRGVDIGADLICQAFETHYHTKTIKAEYSRLLIDLNRSQNHTNVFSEMTKNLDQSVKNNILAIYYHPYREKVINAIEALLLQAQPVLHISVHTFTPELHGKIRQTDIGLLYDPKRTPEKAFCKKWAEQIKKQISPYRVRMNYPYRGNSDGFTVFLRKRYSEKQYLGIELEVNQKYFMDNNSDDLIAILKNSIIL